MPGSTLFGGGEFRLSDPSARLLLDTLVIGYPALGEIRHLLLRTEIRETEIDLGGPAREVWGRVLQRAAPRLQLRSLVEAVLEDPPRAAHHPQLRRLLDEDPELPSAASPVDPVPPDAPPDTPPDTTDMAWSCVVGDPDAARELAGRLRRDGFRCWPDAEREDRTAAAIRASGVVVVCLSARSVDPPASPLNTVLDVADEQPVGSTHLIPARVDDCPVPHRLRRWPRVDLFAEDGYRQLVEWVEWGTGVVQRTAGRR